MSTRAGLGQCLSDARSSHIVSTRLQSMEICIRNVRRRTTAGCTMYLYHNQHIDSSHQHIHKGKDKDMKGAYLCLFKQLMSSKRYMCLLCVHMFPSCHRQDRVIIVSRHKKVTKSRPPRFRFIITPANPATHFPSHICMHRPQSKTAQPRKQATQPAITLPLLPHRLTTTPTTQQTPPTPSSTTPPTTATP
jgi:hypothetical protein